MNKKQIFVVEGKNDVNKLLSIFPKLNVISVNGSQIDPLVVNYLKEISITHEIVLCLDPDYPGKKIRDYLEREIKEVKHIFFDPRISKSKNNKKIGLEHINKEILKLKIKEVLTLTTKVNNITNNHLIDLKLIGFKDSKDLRLKLTNYLQIDNCNGKRLLKRLNGLNIDVLELNKIVANL